MKPQIKKKHDDFINAAINLHKTAHSVEPFITCEALQEGNFIKMKCKDLKQAHELYKTLIAFFASLKKKKRNPV